MTNTIAIETKDLSKRYKLYPGHVAMALDWCGFYAMRFWKKRPSFPLKHALADINLKIEKGQRYGLIGRNGAGKTTLLKIFAGMIAPNSGICVVNGDLQSMMRIGGGFHTEFTGRQNVRFSLLYKGLKGAALDAAMEDVIDFAELGDFIDQPLRNYSLGMASRLQFAAATAVKPDILLIDEVLGAGDAYFAEKSRERMKNLTNSGCTLVLVSHSKTQILEFCNKGIWLDNGKVQMEGDVASVMTAYEAEMIKEINHSPDESLSGMEQITIPIPEQLKSCFQLEKIKGLQPHLSWAVSNLNNVLYVGTESRSNLTLVDVKTFSGNAPRNDSNTGDDFSFHLTFTGEDGLRPLKMKVLCHDKTGELIGTDEITVVPTLNEHGEMTIRYFLHPLPLGYGNYLFSFILEENETILHVASGIYVKINETNDSDPPLLHYIGKWYHNDDQHPLLSRISGMI